MFTEVCQDSLPWPLLSGLWSSVHWVLKVGCSGETQAIENASLEAEMLRAKLDRTLAKVLLCHRDRLVLQCSAAPFIFLWGCSQLARNAEWRPEHSTATSCDWHHSWGLWPKSLLQLHCDWRHLQVEPCSKKQDSLGLATWFSHLKSDESAGASILSLLAGSAIVAAPVHAMMGVGLPVSAAAGDGFSRFVTSLRLTWAISRACNWSAGCLALQLGTSTYIRQPLPTSPDRESGLVVIAGSYNPPHHGHLDAWPNGRSFTERPELPCATCQSFMAIRKWCATSPPGMNESMQWLEWILKKNMWSALMSDKSFSGKCWRSLASQMWKWSSCAPAATLAIHPSVCCRNASSRLSPDRWSTGLVLKQWVYMLPISLLYSISLSLSSHVSKHCLRWSYIWKHAQQHGAKAMYRGLRSFQKDGAAEMCLEAQKLGSSLRNIYDIILLSMFINSFNVSVLNWTGLNWMNGKELEDLETSRSQPVFAFLYGMVAPPEEHQWSTSSWQSASNSHRLHSSRPQVPRFHSARWNLG